MQNNFGLPETGGLFSTDFFIILGVGIVSIILYCIFCLLRGSKNDELKGFSEEDFVDDEQEKQ